MDLLGVLLGLVAAAEVLQDAAGVIAQAKGQAVVGIAAHQARLVDLQGFLVLAGALQGDAPHLAGLQAEARVSRRSLEGHRGLVIEPELEVHEPLLVL